MSERPSPRAAVVLNPDDDVALTRRLDALASRRRLVLRPSPGGGVRDLARDVLAALGKSPEAVLAEEATVANMYRTCAAFSTAAGVTDIVVDRVHRLATRTVEPLLGLALTSGAALWLIWSGPQPTAALITQLRQSSLAARTELLDPAAFYHRLPLQAEEQKEDEKAERPEVLAEEAADTSQAPVPRQAQPWPRLPMTDFPLFLATCHRTLPTADRRRVSDLYRSEMHLASRLPDTTAHALTAYLRDDRLGPAPTPEDALIRLRAIQAALLPRAALLRWQPATLGSDPAARLVTRFTDHTAYALRTAADTESGAATALALYFDTGPTGFDMIRCHDITPDGARFHLPLLSEEEREHLRPPWHEQRGHQKFTGPGESDPLRTQTPVTMPLRARALLAAHHAYRTAQGARPGDPYFIHPSEPSVLSPVPRLREAIIRTCHRLHLDLSWLHRCHCRHGDQLGQGNGDWLAQRGLSIHHLSLNPAPWECP
ncbi:hypothetical protein ACIRPK_36115 [Kitasatospora sp. NPDC101801]|uniref:hypothetical protein n=1 Tax=Kitasatospora sp. NPDC101801 TaxID=3364103 RepID=UPI00381232C0